MNFDFFSLTDPGRVRDNNEDAVACQPAQGLALLADGMGGYNAGEIASAMAMAVMGANLGSWLQSQADPQDAAQVRAAMQLATDDANHQIFQAAQNNAHYQGMGTTLVVGVFEGNRALIGHIGDSRCYRWRDGDLVALTRDHSLLQEQIDAGLLSEEEAQYAPHKNLVTRALGVEPEVELDISEHAVASGDLYLMCSDGLSDMLDDTGIAALLRARPRAAHELSQIGEELVHAANVAGGRDNIAVLLVHATSSPERRGLLSRLFAQ